MFGTAHQAKEAMIDDLFKELVAMYKEIFKEICFWITMALAAIGVAATAGVMFRVFRFVANI